MKSDQPSVLRKDDLGVESTLHNLGNPTGTKQIAADGLHQGSTEQMVYSWASPERLPTLYVTLPGCWGFQDPSSQLSVSGVSI